MTIDELAGGSAVSGGREIVQKRCRQLVQMHGGQRKAAKAVGIDEGYFHHLLHGTKTHASDEVLDKLFIRRDVVFTALPVLFGIGHAVRQERQAHE